MQIFFSTVIRAAPVEKGGELIQLDWDGKKRIAQVRHPSLASAEAHTGTF